MDFYREELNHLFEKFNCTEKGLSSNEAEKRLHKHGKNELQEKKKVSPWMLFLHQFKDFLIIILAIAAVLSGIMGELIETVIILVIILLNAVVGFIQEFRAEKAMEALKKMSTTQTQVIRDGKALSILSQGLVPGDIVILEAGNVVPADMRLLETHSLRINESSLTGESMAVDKNHHSISKENIPLGDRLNMAYKGTLVTNGRAKGLIVATGMKTELGKIAGMLHQEEPGTPLQKRMAAFGKKLSYIILVICIILLVSGIIRGEDPFKILLLSVSLAVAAIPEALPALITVALSRGAAQLAKQNALIRKLPAVETLGSVSFICSDKTGTLTQNKMKVVEIYNHSAIHPAAQLNHLQLAMLLNHDVKFNEQHEAFGESTELALVENISQELGFNAYEKHFKHFERVAELPFDSDRKCMTTVHKNENGFLIITKGAGESISAILKDKKEADILNSTSEIWAQKGIRVLAFAFKYLNELPEPFDYKTVETNLEFAGLAGLMDPPREEAKEAIQECKTAGIKPVMITGDHPATAKAIAKEIGIYNEHDLALTGAELQHIDEETFLKQVEETSVYARVSPEQKLRIVNALQKKGHFVSMTGDGVNDAPSLKSANIGVAMGINGTDVSKEASHMILLDDNFATIVKAVKEGRRIFDNIRKFVKYIMTCNGAEIWTIFLAPLLGMPIPLLPIHILWINLVTDGLPALALANEKHEPDIMKRPPREATESLFSDGVGFHIIWVGLLMAGVTLGTQAWAMNNQVTNWQTMVFTVLSLSQLGHVMGIRSARTFLFKQGLFGNIPLLISIGITFMLQLAVIYLPFMNVIFKTAPLSLNELSICIGLSLVVFHAVEIEKWIKHFIKK
jgi:P-type Ca2+ transporter type 2C